MFTASHIPLLVVSAALVGATFQAALGPQVRLEFAGTSSDACLDAPALERAVAQRLGYAPFNERAPRTLSIVVAASPDGLSAHIAMRDARGAPAGERAFAPHSADCREFVAALALSVAIAIDPLSLLRSPTPAPRAPPAEQEPVYVAPTSKVAAAAEASPTAAAYALDVGAGVVGSMNTTPMLAAGFELLSRVSRGAFSLGLEARLDLPRAQTIEGGAIEGGLATATVPACARAGVLEGCALLTGGVERGTGAGYFDARQATVPYAAAGARGALEWPLARVALRLHADVAAQLVRPLFLIGNHAVWSAPAIAVLVGVDLAAHVR